jgi:hypothetical protein
MNTLPSSATGLCALLLCALLAGCEYRPRETFKIKTSDGAEIMLTCPVVDSRRSTFTYLIDGHCVIEPRAK